MMKVGSPMAVSDEAASLRPASPPLAFKPDTSWIADQGAPPPSPTHTPADGAPIILSSHVSVRSALKDPGSPRLRSSAIKEPASPRIRSSALKDPSGPAALVRASSDSGVGGTPKSVNFSAVQQEGHSAPKVPQVGLGITFFKPDSNQGMLIKRVKPGSGAALCGEIAPGDRLLEIDGTSIKGMNTASLARLVLGIESSTARCKVLKAAPLSTLIEVEVSRMARPEEEDGQMGSSIDSISSQSLSSSLERKLERRWREKGRRMKSNRHGAVVAEMLAEWHSDSARQHKPTLIPNSPTWRTRNIPLGTSIEEEDASHLLESPQSPGEREREGSAAYQEQVSRISNQKTREFDELYAKHMAISADRRSQTHTGSSHTFS